MLKRTLIILSMALALVVVAEPVQTVHGIVMTPAEWLAFNTVDAPAVATPSGQMQEGQGNAFLRALKAPFKAIGRLFGRGKKDDNKLARISEKDAKRFESAAPAVQLSKTAPAAEVSSSGNASSGFASTRERNPADALETSALDYLEKGRALLKGAETFRYRSDMVRRSKRKKRQQLAAEAGLTPSEEKLLADLKALRFKLSRCRRVPPYVIFSDPASSIWCAALQETGMNSPLSTVWANPSSPNSPMSF